MKKLLLLVVLSGCGGATAQDPYPAPAPPPARPPVDGGSGELTFASDIQPLMQQFCAECHSTATFISSQQAFLASKSATRIANKSMPQRQSKTFAQWGDAQRAIVAQFVEENQ